MKGAQRAKNDLLRMCYMMQAFDRLRALRDDVETAICEMRVMLGCWQRWADDAGTHEFRVDIIENCGERSLYGGRWPQLQQSRELVAGRKLWYISEWTGRALYSSKPQTMLWLAPEWYRHPLYMEAVMACPLVTKIHRRGKRSPELTIAENATLVGFHDFVTDYIQTRDEHAYPLGKWWRGKGGTN